MVNLRLCVNERPRFQNLRQTLKKYLRLPDTILPQNKISRPKNTILRFQNPAKIFCDNVYSTSEHNYQMFNKI